MSSHRIQPRIKSLLLLIVLPAVLFVSSCLSEEEAKAVEEVTAEMGIDMIPSFGVNSSSDESEAQGTSISFDLKGHLFDQIDSSAWKYIAGEAMSRYFEKLPAEKRDEYDYLEARIETADGSLGIEMKYDPGNLEESFVWRDKAEEIAGWLSSGDTAAVRAHFQNPEAANDLAALYGSVKGAFAKPDQYRGFYPRIRSSGLESVTLAFIAPEAGPKPFLTVRIDPFAQDHYISGMSAEN